MSMHTRFVIGWSNAIEAMLAEGKQKADLDGGGESDSNYVDGPYRRSRG
jgi:hypothetical protein